MGVGYFGGDGLHADSELQAQTHGERGRERTMMRTSRSCTWPRTNEMSCAPPGCVCAMVSHIVSERESRLTAGAYPSSRTRSGSTRARAGRAGCAHALAAASEAPGGGSDISSSPAERLRRTAAAIAKSGRVAGGDAPLCHPTSLF